MFGFRNPYDSAPGPEPVPVPVPSGPPSASDDQPVQWATPTKRRYAERYWRFIRWQVARERRNWPDRMQAPLEVSPDARYVNG